MSGPPTNPFRDGRDQQGRFVQGNGGGPGNPHAAKVARLRSSLLDAVTEQDVRDVLTALVREAKRGNVQVMREFFNRVLGQLPPTTYVASGKPVRQARAS